MTRKTKKIPPSRIQVRLGVRSYEAWIGRGLLEGSTRYLKKVKSKRAYIVADEKLTLPRARLKTALTQGGWEVHEFAVPAGEGLKEFEAIYPLYGKLLEAKADRDSTLFALGGGSVGDAVGFIASTFLRGVDWVGVPTTLLAQVDSALGGKTGINHPAGKNLIGSFYQPRSVLCDLESLDTLSQRELVSGLGEVIKYGFAYDPAFFRWIRAHAHAFLTRDPVVLKKAVEKSLYWKARAVSRDEWDRKGIREVLNLGHTFGHALESLTEYRAFQHGEAVIWGMRFALALSQVRKKLSSEKRRDWDGFLSSLPVPPLPEGVGAQDYFKKMARDKKVRNGKIHFVLIRDLGNGVSDSGVTEKHLQDAFELLKNGGVT